MKEDLGIVSTKTDPYLYFKFNKEGDLMGINGAYIDGILRTGHDSFKS